MDKTFQNGVLTFSSVCTTSNEERYSKEFSSYQEIKFSPIKMLLNVNAERLLPKSWEFHLVRRWHELVACDNSQLILMLTELSPRPPPMYSMCFSGPLQPPDSLRYELW